MTDHPAAPSRTPAPTAPDVPTLVVAILETGPDGRARFRDEAVALDGGSDAARLSALAPSGGWQLRRSPPGFRSAMHCTARPAQWVVILEGRMRIGLADGASRVFAPGQMFFSADHLPDGAAFDPAVHGHWSAQEGDAPLVTMFVRGA